MSPLFFASVLCLYFLCCARDDTLSTTPTGADTHVDGICVRLSMAICTLTTRRKSYFGHIYLAVVGCVSVIGVEDTATNVTCASPDRQIPIVHVSHELHLHTRHRGHHQLELSRAAHAQNAQLGAQRIS